jgi:ketosteroid isomerase-like protein
MQDVKCMHNDPAALAVIGEGFLPIAALQGSVEAWNEGDLTRHLAIYDPSVSFMTRDGQIAGIEATRQFLEQNFFAGCKPRQTLHLEDVTARSLAAACILVTGRFVLSGGDQASQSGWISLIWTLTLEGWRVVHDHSG